MTADCNKYVESARLAARWIVEQQNPDGPFFDADVGGCYKVPYAPGCAIPVTIINDLAARQGAASVAGYLVRTQTDEGFWRLPDEEVYQTIENKNDPEILMDITADRDSTRPPALCKSDSHRSIPEKIR